jgi:hypothetical protein
MRRASRSLLRIAVAAGVFEVAVADIARLTRAVASAFLKLVAREFNS